jgi:hypothetical protein
MLKCQQNHRQQIQEKSYATGAGRKHERLKCLQELFPNPLQLEQEYGHLEPNCRIRHRQLCERARSRKRRNRVAERRRGNGVNNKRKTEIWSMKFEIWGLEF